jgi:acetyl esterase
MQDPAEALDGELSPDMAALMARVAAEDGPMPDTTLMLPAEGRRMVRESGLRWREPVVTTRWSREVRVPADSTVGSAEVRCLVHMPLGAIRGTILFVHGGGFAFSDPERHSRCAMLMAEAAGMAVVLPDYRLAPEDPFPAGLHDTVATLRALARQPEIFGLDAGPIVMAGDSAGANLALTSLLHPAGREIDAVAGAVLFYGVYTADFTTPSYRRFFNGPGLTTPKMQRYWDWYAPDFAARRNPLVAPVLADDAQLAALPPLYLTAAGVDPLLSDTLQLHARLTAIGRADPLHVEPGVIHGYLQMSNSLEAAARTLNMAGAAARQMVRP